MTESSDRFLPVDLDAVRSSLREWYLAEHRSYPWRETDDP